MAGLPWAIQGEEKKKFETIFDSLNPVNGKLGGDRVKPILLNSKLSNEILGKVWELSDIDKDGQLDREEFSVAMHLVYKALDQEPVPSILPQELVPLSKRKPMLPGAVSVLPPLPLITSTPKATQNSDILINTSSPTLQPQRPSLSSNLYIKGYIPDVEIQRFSSIFTQKADPEGYIHGADARGVFVQSQLPQHILAHVWNICDQTQLGKLNKDQFILSMHFITQKVKGIEVPGQLPNEVLTPKSRDSGFGDPGNLSDSSSSGIGDFSAVKELDALNREIEELRLEKETLSREIEEKKRIVQIRSSEVQELQNTLDRASTSLSQLESDKSEAHTRLDDLDQQQLKLDHMIAHVRSKIEEENRAVMTLQSQIKAQELANKRQEEEYSKARSELENLKKEESRLQQTLQIGEQQLQNITKQVTDTENEIAKVKEQIALLGEKRKNVSSNIEQYDKAVVALKNEKEVTDSLISKMEAETLPRVTEASPNPDSFFSSDNDFGKTGTFDAFEPSGRQSHSGTPFDDKGQKNEDDMFSTTNDFFSSESTFKTENNADPFSGSDPFASSTSVGWNNKTTGNSSQNSGEKFSVTFDDSNSSSLFNEADNVKSKTTPASDPWAAFGSVSNSHSSAQKDPFGGDMFGSNASGNSGFDQAFGSSFASQSNANNNSGEGFGANSFEDEKKRKEKLKIQEQQDYELALKLSKEM